MSLSNFSCYQCTDDGCNVPEKELPFCINAIFCWKSSFREFDESFRYARGCVHKVNQLKVLCNSEVLTMNNRYRTECCITEFCNGGSFPALGEPQPDPTMTTKKVILTVIAAMFFLLVCILIVMFCYQKNRAQRQNTIQPVQRRRIAVASARSSATYRSRSSSIEMTKITPSDDTTTTVKEHLDGQSSTSKSRSVKPSLSQHNLTKEIVLVKSLSTGSFGKQQQPKLWRATWKNADLMVKIYSSRSEPIWAHETEVYTKLLPSKHVNILEYVGSDTTTVEDRTELWLVTRNQPNGSLVNYLKTARLNQEKMLKAFLSLTQGLFYLHTEVHGKKSKLSMAHRNLSANNVFVRKDGVCVIGGLECVATQERFGDSYFLEIASKRYMSPELLDPDFENGIWSLQDFQQADIYSLSLIFWEICSVYVQNNEDVSRYAASFSEWLPNGNEEPTIEQMRTLILDQKKRPEIPDHWHTDPIMNELGSMIQECWKTTPSDRLSILLVHNALSKLVNK